MEISTTLRFSFVLWINSVIQTILNKPLTKPGQRQIFVLNTPNCDSFFLFLDLPLTILLSCCYKIFIHKKTITKFTVLGTGI